MTRTLPEKSLHVIGAFNISTKDDISGYLPSAAVILGDEIFHHNSLAVLFAQEHLFTVKQPAVPVHDDRSAGFSAVSCNGNGVGVGELFGNDVLAVRRS